MEWISQNWFFLLFLFALVFFGWFAWPRMQPNTRRIVAGGMGLTSLAIFLARLAGGAALDPKYLARAAVMGLAGILLLLAAYLPRLQGSWPEMAGWAMLGASALVSLLFPGTSLFVQGLVLVSGTAVIFSFQRLVESPVSEWEDPGQGRQR